MCTSSWRHRLQLARVSHATSSSDKQKSLKACTHLVSVVLIGRLRHSMKLTFIQGKHASNVSYAHRLGKLLSSIQHQPIFTFIGHGMFMSSNYMCQWQGHIVYGVPLSVALNAPCLAVVDRRLPTLCQLLSHLWAWPTNIVQPIFGVAYLHHPWPTYKCQECQTWPACIKFDLYKTLNHMKTWIANIDCITLNLGFPHYI